MRIIGDGDRNRIYTLSEMEKKEKMEIVLSTECDIMHLLKMDPKDKEIRRESIESVIKGPERRKHKSNCNCPVIPFKQTKYLSLKGMTAHNSGRCNLDGTQIGYIVPRNTALGKEFRSLLLLLRQMVLVEKSSDSTSIEFFALWLAVNIVIIVFLYIERILSK
ncbi:hypothetical protein NEFER03_0582 [Nematocida sp. LUAm3]|nr:hypothetical protein NEFER03_0582 [Nematocida sp. LUAm3]KAI5175549.1 hypothetical protein NEFER02_1455 [Nematocida sp. LUAm2]KAI5178421.1 hypothetical protein NEFER01_1568 [Nematocida sp. LUAm1]